MRKLLIIVLLIVGCEEKVSEDDGKQKVNEACMSRAWAIWRTFVKRLGQRSNILDNLGSLMRYFGQLSSN